VGFKAALTLLAFIVLGSSQAIEAASFAFTPIDLPAGLSADVQGINDSGQIVGSFLDGVHPYQGFLFDGGTFSIINVPGAGSTQMSAINNAGQMVGTFGNSGFLYSGGQFTTLSVPGAAVTMPMDINNAGTVVGNYLASSGASYTGYGFVYRDGTFTSLGTLPCAKGINDSGQILECNGILNPNGTVTPFSITGTTAFKYGFQQCRIGSGLFCDFRHGAWLSVPGRDDHGD
jgi:probable HAF family extracellular repeat protein